MRISTKALLRAAFFLFVVAAMAPQISVAQLNLETRKLIMQGSGSGALTLEVPATVSSYTLSMPGAAPFVGSVLYQTSNGLQWSNVATSGYVLTTDGSSVNWTDPTSALNPNWSLTGNAIVNAWNGTASSGSYIGTNSDKPLVLATTNATAQAIQFFTGANGATEAMRITGTGNVGIGTTSPTTKLSVTGTFNATGASTFGATVDITGSLTVGSDKFTVNASTGEVTQTGSQVTFGGNVDATNGLDVTTGSLTVGATNFTVAPATGNTSIAGTLTQTGSSSQVSFAGNVDATKGLDISGDDLTIGTDKFTVDDATGNTATKGYLNLNGTTNELQMNGSAGTDGQVLVSKGSNLTPAWSSIGSAIGIRAAGVVAVSGLTATTAISASGMEATDAIIVTLQTASGSTVVGTVTNRDNTADTFVVTFSGSFTGSVNYLVIKTF